MSSLNIIIIEKTGILKSLLVKEFDESELFKKCGFKKAEEEQLSTRAHAQSESPEVFLQNGAH
jgi:N-acetylglutamate synthase-like GNAT family acetyltransferase